MLKVCDRFNSFCLLYRFSKDLVSSMFNGNKVNIQYGRYPTKQVRNKVFQINKKEETKMLRSIQKAYEEIKKDDPNTSITPYTIRRWCQSGKIRHLLTGNKILVDMESLTDFIEGNNEN